MVSISRDIRPNDFTVHLSMETPSPSRLTIASLRDELIQYASTHAENKTTTSLPPRGYAS